LHIAIFSYLAVTVLGGLTAYLISRAVTGGRAVLFGPQLRVRLRYGFLVCLAGVLSVANYRADFFIAVRLLGNSTGGLYSMIEMLGEVVWFVPDAVILVFLPRAVRNEQETGGRDANHAASRQAVFLSLLATVGISAAGGLFLFMTGDPYRGATSAFLWSLPGVFAACVAKMIFALMMARGDLPRGTLALLVALIVNISCSALLAPLWGIDGVAAGSSLSFAVVALLLSRIYCGSTATPLAKVLIPTSEDLRYYRRLLDKLDPRTGRS
jgi:O-antigen/teichoic acid export membrane protein